MRRVIEAPSELDEDRVTCEPSVPGPGVVVGGEG